MALTATNTLFGNIVKWGAPSQRCVAYFKVFRRADELTAEVTDKIAEVAWSENPHYVDLFGNLNENVAYNYYVKAVSYADKSSALSAKISASVTTVVHIGHSSTTDVNVGTAAQTIAIGGATSVITFPANVGGWLAGAITAGGTSICTYTASGDTSILNVMLKITAEASADTCTVAISGGGTIFLTATKATAALTLIGTGIITLSSGSTITVAMTADVSDEIGGSLKINRVVL